MNIPEPIIFEAKTNAGVIQDKKPPWRFTKASEEPVSATPAAVHQKHHGSETRQTLLLAGRVPPHIKEEVMRIAKLKGWTPSYTVNTLVQQGLARNLAESFGVMLKKTIQEAITTQMDKERKENNRAATFAFESFRTSEEMRVIGLYILRFLLDEDIEILPEIIKQAHEDTDDYIKEYFGETGANHQQWRSSKSNI